ncbi:hypothetical protein MGYG_06928 [Nannizzia gypsea CBS 118893]|uniref:Uncharacterized protein n=1 Tax=Arthroderma gypseum (strain ATCC MYA-4604 / CBS 118893) TaxID=535722 RepID=E4V1L4_ARTGP|nr:hypothetical protein MGYG_06928 [Nannizzia gypsea CBS 118893]EFR03929.1 hypothetical protein MGYG_06928 [Nannizzia gypsea CBS 118893]
MTRNHQRDMAVVEPTGLILSHDGSPRPTRYHYAFSSSAMIVVRRRRHADMRAQIPYRSRRAVIPYQPKPGPYRLQCRNNNHAGMVAVDAMVREKVAQGQLHVSP